MISVVIPALNEEKFLPKCLSSLSRQDYRGKLEIIVVNNGSSDRTLQIAKGFGARVISCRAVGVVNARRAGADAALGEIIVQADADTIYPADWLSRIFKRISRRGIVALTGNFKYTERVSWEKLEFYFRHCINMLAILVNKKPVYVSGANFAFYRDAYIKSGGYDESAFSPDQFGLANKLCRFGRIIYDKDLTVRTSSRRVQKPLIGLAWDTFKNLQVIARHISKGKFNFASQKRPLKWPARD